MISIIEELEKGQKTQESSTKLMENLIQDLLDYAQIKAGKFRMNLNNFDLKQSVKEVTEILQEKAEAKNITFEYNFDNLELNSVYHDEQRIK